MNVTIRKQFEWNIHLLFGTEYDQTKQRKKKTENNRSNQNWGGHSKKQNPKKENNNNNITSIRTQTISVIEWSTTIDQYFPIIYQLQQFVIVFVFVHFAAVPEISVFPALDIEWDQDWMALCYRVFNTLHYNSYFDMW